MMDADKIKDFAVYNFEKLIVAIVVGMSGFLVYSGYGQPLVSEKHDPKALADRANQTRSEVDNDHTDKVIEERIWDFDINAELAKFRQRIVAKPYQPEAWDGTKVAAEKTRRVDPVLSKPTGIQVTPVVATLAYRSADGLYALTELEPADELERVEAKPKRKTKRDRQAEMMAMMDGGGYGEEMMEMDMMDMMGEGMDPSMTGDSTASGPNRKLDAEDNLGTTAKTTTSITSGAEQQPVPGLGLFIAGTAAIPHKELIDSYQEALSEAAEYDPIKRDRPLYVAYEVQRADVTNKQVDELAEEDWIVRDSNDITIFNAVDYWSGFAPEVVPSDYFVDGVTMWIPPVLLDPYMDFAVNPLVPLKSQRDLQAELAEAEAAKAEEDSGPIDRKSFEVVVKGGQSRSFGSMMMDEMDMMEGMGMDEGYDMEMEMGYGAGGTSRSAHYGKPAEEDPVDYKLLRFYDFYYIKGAPKQDPQRPIPGRNYVYRIRFAVNDPNFPQEPELQPKGSNLDPDAYSRYVALVADAEQNQKRDYKRWSEWSDLSAPVALPRPGQFDQNAFGPVKSAKARKDQGWQ